MSAGVPFLFVGGPWDGQIHALAGRPHSLAVAEVDSQRIASWDGSFDTDVPVVDAIARSFYESRRLALFGRAVDVMVHETIARYPAGVEDALARHLLSPLAIGLGGYEREPKEACGCVASA